MNIFKKGFLAIARKPIRSMISLLMIFCMAVLTTIGISASHTSYHAQLEARNQVGAYFELTIDVENFGERLEELTLQGYDLLVIPEGTNMGFLVPPSNEFYSLNLDDITVLSEIEGLSDFNVEALWFEMRVVDFNRIEGAFPRATDIPTVSLRGIRDLSLLPLVGDESIRLIDGRWIQPDDVNKLVISEEIAELNGLSVGDYMTFETIAYEDTPRLEVMERLGIFEPEIVQIRGEIVGIFESNRSITLTPGVIARSSENTIFTNLHFTEVGIREGDPLYYKAHFHVENIDDFELIRERLISADIDWSRYELIDRNETILELGSTFEQLRGIGQLLLGVTIVSSFLVLSLTFTFMIKSRSHEIGIWLSLGTSKFKIIGQILLENLLLATVSLIICFAIVPLLVNGAETVLNQQIVAEVEDSQMAGVYVVEDIDDIETVQLVITTDTLVIVVASISLLITTATVFGILPIIRLKPREIFARLS